jgi:hypothetical protein
MFRPGNRSLQAVFPLAACLLLAAGSGCGARPLWFRGKEGPLLEQVKASELRPGCYCEIEMVVPPASPDGSSHCFKGTVQEVNHDEVVLSDVLEESCVEYGMSSHRRPPTQQKRDVVRVPLLGVDTIWALPPTKEDAAAKPPSKPSTPKLPSSGAQAALPPPAACPTTAEEEGTPPAASRLSAPPLPDTPARFDPPPATGGVAR